MPIHAVALFADRHAGHAAVEQLVQAGFTRDAISILMTEDTYEREFAAPISDGASTRPNRTGVLSAIVAGLAVLARPGGLALRAAGPLVAAMLEAGEAWSLSAALVSAGLEEHEARLLDEGVRAGSIAVSVLAVTDRASLAQKLLELSGGLALQAA
jgi:hypothetical protein